MKTLITHLFTGADNATFDIGRILWAISVVVFLALAVYAVIWKGQPWAPQDYGTGLGLVLAAGGAAIGFKSSAEPKP